MVRTSAIPSQALEARRSSESQDLRYLSPYVYLTKYLFGPIWHLCLDPMSLQYGRHCSYLMSTSRSPACDFGSMQDCRQPFAVAVCHFSSCQSHNAVCSLRAEAATAVRGVTLQIACLKKSFPYCQFQIVGSVVSGAVQAGISLKHHKRSVRMCLVGYLSY